MTWGEMSAVIFNLIAFKYVHPAETQMAFRKGNHLWDKIFRLHSIHSNELQESVQAGERTITLF